MRLTTKLIPVNGYDMAALRIWLQDMAARGLQYAYAVGPFIQFRSGRARDIQIHLEPVRKGTQREETDLSELYTQADWEYWGKFKELYYVYAAEGTQSIGHTEPEVLEYALERLSRRLRWRCVGIAAALLGSGWYVWDQFGDFFFGFDFRYAPVYSILTSAQPYWMLPLIPALTLLLISMMRGLAKLYGLIYALHSGEKSETPRIRGGGWLKGVWLCLLLIPLFWTFQVRYEGSVPLDELKEHSGYVRLKELETAPGFSCSSVVSRDLAGQRRQLLIPLQYDSQEWGGYNVTKQTHTMKNGVTMTTYSPQQYYLKTQFLQCRTEGIARTVFREQEHWAYFKDGTRVTHPGFDELIVNLERGGETLEFEGDLSLRVGDSEVDIPMDLSPNDMNRWNLYGRAGENVLFVEYRGSGDLREYLPDFAEMIQKLGEL